ncbi:G-type lectin S-receptor-like serine/threonine-protein kinase LECRK3 [Bidens hawaiensis]|uniref:G-type lectin S-receptor-like serine/threonine-protein kinase LECRK3 n=1 Tax=Bidens hawaiensis TaxID=980011 RepID=UPI00404B29D2
MASLIAFLFTISLAFNIAKSQSNITRGSSLTPTGANTSWFSPSRLFAFGFYPQTGGYAVGIYIAGVPEKTVVWTASRETLPFSNNATLRFTSDGRLTMEQTQGQETNLFDTSGASFASMQNSGNFVLYDSTGTVLWQSFANPTDTLLAGQRLLPGQTLYSSVSKTDHSIGVFQLSMQTDGNLVLYPNRGTDDRAYWAAGTYEAGPNVTLNLASDGFLYLLQNSTFFIYNLTQRGYPTKDALYVMKFDVDGIFRLYFHNLTHVDKNGSIIWAASSNKCMAVGLCGINGYCSVVNDAARCQCLPGFEVVNPDLWTSGCRRNNTIESCKIQDAASTTIRMTNLNNALWEDAAYLITKAQTQEECSSACLNDCNCEAALFTGQECKLQGLPLRYVQVVASESNVGLIKVYTSTNKNGWDPTNDQPVHVKKVRQKNAMIIGVSLISFAVLVLIISGVIMYRTQAWAYRKISENLNVQLFEDMGPRAFSYASLEEITDGFKEELGRGSFGIVYKGIISSSMRQVAVKKLKEELAQEGEREFQTEVKVIGRTHHRNLTRLLGYCCEGPQRLLVFEYMTQGSLADILFGPKESKPKPSWIERIRMAVDIAHGILYLHEECDNPIIHCDIKPQNILMDEYGCAKISDFGLAKLLEHDQTKTSTLIRGTRGYVAPEWHKGQQITVKVDVYSFGIVLFNILCCRRNVDNSLPDGEAILEDWVYECYEADEVLKLVDYDDDVEKKRLEQMIKIGLWCVQEEPSLRPSMKRVVLMLEGTVKIPAPPNPTSFLSVV